MGHAHHFLSRLDRVSHQQVELSLGLYNNAPLLKDILARSGLPKGADRVAICLDDRNEGPWIIVTREGRFVTCLAKGMRHDLPTVRRWQLDHISQRHESLRKCMRPVDDVPEEEQGLVQLLRPAMKSGPNLSREQFLDLSTFQPVMFHTYLELLHETAGQLIEYGQILRTVERARSHQEPLLELYWERVWFMRHLLVLLGVGEPIEYWEGSSRDALEAIVDSPACYAANDCASPVSLAGAWSTARFGRAYLPICGARFERENPARMHQAALELISIASLDEDHRDVITRALRSVAEPVANDAPVSHGRSLRATSASDALRALCGDDIDVRAARRGAELLIARNHPVAVRNGWRSALDVPLDVALPYASQHVDGWACDSHSAAALYALAPSVARYRPEDFFLPARWLREMRVEWTAERSIALLRMQRVFFSPREPARAAPTQGRNDACACKSGKKFKKCCAITPRVVTAPAPKVESAPWPTLANGVMPRRELAPLAPRPSLFPPAPKRDRAVAYEDHEAIDAVA